MEDKLIATEINRIIEEMLNIGHEIPLYGDSARGFNTDYSVIRSTFECGDIGHCSKDLSVIDIHRRLALIDLLYSTNIYRMRQYGLDELAECIWNLCDNGNGIHCDHTLVSKVLISNPISPDVLKAFDGSFGYIKFNSAGKATSLLSKYIFFVTVSCRQDDWGFPIYDSLASELVRPMQKCLGLPLSQVQQVCNNANKFDISIYRKALKDIIDILENDNPKLWNYSYSGMTKFELLDFFLWHIGKAGHKSYSLLYTRAEASGLGASLTNIPQRIQDWEKIYTYLKSL